MSEDELRQLAKNWMQAKHLAVAAAQEENRIKADLSAAEREFNSMRSQLESAATADSQVVSKFTVDNVQRVALAEARFNHAKQKHEDAQKDAEAKSAAADTLWKSLVAVSGNDLPGN